MMESRAEKIMELLDIEFKLRADEFNDRRVVKHIRRFTFPHDERENIIHYAKDLFEKIEDDKIDYYIKILFDLLIQYELTVQLRYSSYYNQGRPQIKERDKKKKICSKGLMIFLIILVGLLSKMKNHLSLE